MRTPTLALALALALVLAPALALAQPEAYRYVAATGLAPAGTFVACGLGARAEGASVTLPRAELTVNGQPIPVGGQQVVVEGATVPPLGGACSVAAAPNATLVLRAVDDAVGDVAFQVFFANQTVAGSYTPGDCAPPVRSAGGPTTVTVPWPCVGVHVIPDAGSVSGSVHVTR